MTIGYIVVNQTVYEILVKDNIPFKCGKYSCWTHTSGECMANTKDIKNATFYTAKYMLLNVNMCVKVKIKVNLFLKNRISYYLTRERAEMSISKCTKCHVHKNYNFDGSLLNEFFHNHDKIDGVYKTYRENGTLSYTINYLNGKLNGNEYIYYETGEIFEIREYNNDVVSTKIKLYSWDGEERIYEYDKNELYNIKKEHDKNGNLTENYLFCRNIIMNYIEANHVRK